MERATTLQGPRDDNIVPLLHLTVFLCIAILVMILVEKVYMAVKFFRKRSGRHREIQYVWEPIDEEDEIIVQIPWFNEVHQISVGVASRVSWRSDQIIIQKLDDSTDSGIKERNEEIRTENERNQDEEIRTENERNQDEEIRTENERNQDREIRTIKYKEDENERNQEEEEIRTTEDENERNQEEEIRTIEEKERWKRVGDPVEERKSQAKRRKKEGPEWEGGSKAEVIVGEVSEEKGRWKRGGDTLRERKSQAKRRKKAEVNHERRKKRKQQCRWVRSCMAMGCAAIFTSALIYLCATNIPEEEMIYLVPT